MTHAELVQRAARWLSNTQGCSVVFTEFSAYSVEAPDAIGWSSWHSTLVECKVSRADFLADRGKPWRRLPYRGMGARRYFMTPAGLVRPDELPAKWGLAEVHGRQVRIIRESEGFSERNRAGEVGFLVSMLRRTQLRIDEPISDWLRYERRKERTA